MRVLTNDPKSVDSIGLKAGCQLLGLGGVGKSAIAGRAMERLAAKGWTIAAVNGDWTLGQLGTSLAIALPDSGETSRAAQLLLRPDLPDDARLQVIGNLLARHHILLVLDNFEDNLVLSASSKPQFRDAATAQVMAALYQSAQTGKLLITSRYPLPESDASLATEHIGPLSIAQTRKLFVRLALSAIRSPRVFASSSGRSAVIPECSNT